MFALLIIVLFGILFSNIATQNTTNIPVHLFGYDIGGYPLYLISLISLLVGIAISWVISLLDWASTTLSLRGKDAHISRTEDEINRLQQRIKELKAENDSLRNDKEAIRTRANEKITEIKDRYSRGGFLDRIRHNPSV